MLMLIRLVWSLFWWVIGTIVGLVIAILFPILFCLGLAVVVDKDGRVLSVLAVVWRWVCAPRQRAPRQRVQESDTDLDPSEF